MLSALVIGQSIYYFPGDTPAKDKQILNGMAGADKFF